MKMRTIKKAHEELMQLDPGCCLTLRAFTSKIDSGEWPCIYVGRKRLVDVDRIIEILEGGKI